MNMKKGNTTLNSYFEKCFGLERLLSNFLACTSFLRAISLNVLHEAKIKFKKATKTSIAVFNIKRPMLKLSRVIFVSTLITDTFQF